MTTPKLLIVVLLLQVLPALFFLSDILLSAFGVPVAPIPWRLREVMEIGAGIGLITGVVMGALALRSMQRQKARAEEALRVASGAFMEIVDERFGKWGLTPAEKDVAMFALKGFSLSEIAGLRDTSEGTVKAQTAAIYRKAGVSGRTQLLSVFVDDLMADGGVSPEA